MRRCRRTPEAVANTVPVLRTQALSNRTVQSTLFHLQVHQGNGRLRLAVDSLRCKAPMVDARGDVRFAQRFVGKCCPALAEIHVFLSVIGQLMAAPFQRRHVEAGLGTQACGSHFASSRQQMSVKVARITTGPRLVNRQVHCDLVALGNLLREGSCQRSALRRVQLRRQRHLVFARHSSVMALLSVLGRVPKSLTIASPGGSVFELRWQEDLDMGDIAAMPVVMQLAAALVANALTRTIRSRRSGATACAA